MRPEPNNDIDLLLRQLNRRNGAPVSQIDEHLDADELNSYVAKALPSAARARYTAHLADCSSCRKLVVELSAAYGPVALQPSEPVVCTVGIDEFSCEPFFADGDAVCRAGGWVDGNRGDRSCFHVAPGLEPQFGCANE